MPTLWVGNHLAPELRNHLTPELGNHLTPELGNHLTPKLGNDLALRHLIVGNIRGPRQEIHSGVRVEGNKVFLGGFVPPLCLGRCIGWQACNELFE